MQELDSNQKMDIVKKKIKEAKQAVEAPVQKEIRADYQKLADLLDQAANKDPSLKQLAVTAREAAGVDHHDRHYDTTYNTRPEGNGILERLASLISGPSDAEKAFEKEYDTRSKEDFVANAFEKNGAVVKSAIKHELKTSIVDAFHKTEDARFKITAIESAAQNAQVFDPDAAITTLLANFRKEIQTYIPGNELQKPSAGGVKPQLPAAIKSK